MHIISDTQLIIEKDFEITWHIVKYAFIAKEYKSGLEDRKVYIIIQ